MLERPGCPEGNRSDDHAVDVAKLLSGAGVPAAPTTASLNKPIAPPPPAPTRAPTANTN
ncbi:hypothetical protein ZHAS_00017312 [Anopheles sinensis]|uniref:Uncharacterized protein n=1 Tax=Anopheles sinensis TaxID=74873 RepID=A0A084WG11_ANOSI|nr:hypothetical protein ZHAS_00017312 [Anopheles sinensis]